ncbi:MAG: Fic family protein [Oscillospiraceae bacterium]|nr:Fic family protein [Oscillospiraceae bacterium]
MKIHKTIINNIGGNYGIKDMSILEACVNSSMSDIILNKKEVSVIEKIARLGYSFIKHKPFISGNISVSLLSIILMLDINNIPMNIAEKDMLDISLKIYQSNISYEDILLWISNNIS